MFTRQILAGYPGSLLSRLLRRAPSPTGSGSSSMNRQMEYVETKKKRKKKKTMPNKEQSPRGDPGLSPAPPKAERSKINSEPSICRSQARVLSSLSVAESSRATRGAWRFLAFSYQYKPVSLQPRPPSFLLLFHRTRRRKTVFRSVRMKKENRIGPSIAKIRFGN